jgi:hypothetical protein
MIRWFLKRFFFEWRKKMKTGVLAIGLIVSAFALVFIGVIGLAGCTMPGATEIPSAVPATSTDSTMVGSWDGSALSFSLPGNGNKSMGSKSVISSSAAQSLVNVYQVYVYDTSGNVFHSMVTPSTSGNITVGGISMSQPTGNFKIIVLGGHNPTPSNPSGMPTYLVESGKTTATLTRGSTTAVSINMLTCAFNPPPAISTTTGSSLNGAITGGNGIQELSLQFGAGLTYTGFDATGIVDNQAYVNVGATQPDGTWTGTFQLNTGTSADTVTLWYSSSALSIYDGAFTTVSGGFTKTLADGTTGWVVPSPAQYQSSYFTPPFTCTTTVTIAMGPTQVGGSISTPTVGASGGTPSLQ